MKIDVKQSGKTRFSNIKTRDVFEFEGNFYLKVGFSAGLNAVNLNSASLWAIADEAMVTLKPDAVLYV